MDDGEKKDLEKGPQTIPKSTPSDAPKTHRGSAMKPKSVDQSHVDSTHAIMGEDPMEIEIDLGSSSVNLESTNASESLGRSTNPPMAESPLDTRTTRSQAKSTTPNDPLEIRGRSHSSTSNPEETGWNAAPTKRKQSNAEGSTGSVSTTVAPVEVLTGMSLEGSDRDTVDQPPNKPLTADTSAGVINVSTVSRQVAVSTLTVTTHGSTQEKGLSDAHIKEPPSGALYDNITPVSLPGNTANATVSLDPTANPKPAQTRMSDATVKAPSASFGPATANAANVGGAKSILTEPAPSGDAPSSTVVLRSNESSVLDDVSRQTNAALEVSVDTNQNTRAPAASFQQAIQQAANEEAIALARAPLADVYGSFLCHSTDSSLDDARNRLKSAIDQTRELRQTFTDRVYSKYRVSLRAPLTTDEIVANIKADPVGQLRKLKEEMVAMREEKEIEKKEATKLNHEMNQSGGSERIPVLLNIDNAEQLMFFTAGLNLVILPEEQSDRQLLREQSDSSPVNQFSSQRARSISQAAASAGEVILDRTRKAAAMRVERQRRRQLQLLRGEVAPDEAEINYSRLQVFSSAGSTSQQPAHLPTTKAIKAATVVGTKQSTAALRRVPPTSGKAGRSRAQASLPSSILLSLNPTADEVKNDNKPSAATLALISRGVGPIASKTTQQRLRHPHPESFGGRRRATMNPGKRDDESSSHPPEPFLQSYLANTLPPLPAAKDRPERKALLVAQANSESSESALRSLQSVLGLFKEGDNESSLHSVSKISVMNGLRKIDRNHDAKQLRPTQGDFTAAAQPRSPVPHESPLSSSVTLSVLFALGILDQSQPGSTQKAFAIPDTNNDNTGYMSSKLRVLKGQVSSKERTLTESILGLKATPSKRTRSGGTAKDSPSKQPRFEDQSEGRPSDTDIPVISIRGGGGTSPNDGDANEHPTASAAEANVAPIVNAPAPSEQKKRKRSESSPGRPSVASVPRAQSDQGQPVMLPGAAQMAFLSSQLGNEQFNPTSSMSAFHLANQLHHMHHPAAGDLAEYLGSLQQQQGFDIAALMTGATQPQFSPLGFLHPNPSLVGYTLQDRASAARAMLVREQQAAAILGGYQPQATGFTPVGSHHAAFLGGNGSSTLGGQQQITAEDTTRQLTPPSLQTDIQANRVHQSKPVEETRVSDQDMHAEVTIAQTFPSDVTAPKKQPASDACEQHSAIHEEEDDKKPSATVPKTGASRALRGMAFIAPATPPSLHASKADQIRSSNFHKVAASMDKSEYSVALDFLLAVGAAVPIPKGLITAPLKERLNTPGFKSAGVNSAPPISREVIAAVVLVWLWTKHEESFQYAFEKNGRIDVDPECKWLIQTAVDTAVGELSLEIAESMARGEGAFAEASAARKASPHGTDPASAESSYSVVSKKLDVRIASIVCAALSVEMCITGTMNSVIPKYAQLVEYLDEARLGALRLKAQERVLLATLIARMAIMTENFAQAYVSAMVRAGEALGHGRLFEVAQDEGIASSTMIPYDIFTDESGAWEDPCKGENCFSPMMTGDDLMRRAHARAMIQKSLRKLQDRNIIRGGTPTFGPFTDPPGCGDSASSSNFHDGKEQAQISSPRPGKRRIVSVNEPVMVPGSGSAAARSWTVYNPKHFCSPLEWDPDELENCPYGLHPRGDRVRAIAIASGRNGRLASLSLSTVQSETSQNEDVHGSLLPSTMEIDWAEVANIFQSVEVPKKASRYRPVEPEKTTAVDGIIFAPSCRHLDCETAIDETESDTEEELTEEAILASHQVVLDDMKAKLEEFLEARKKQQERRKNKQR